VHELVLVGRTDDNTGLIFMDEDGQEFVVAIDDHIRRNINVPAPRDDNDQPFGISPRDIQSRLRRGESPASIAFEAGVDEERIARYAGPVLSERIHMAERAANTAIRRPHSEILLSEIVVNQLALRDVDTTALTWDSYRREDARWTVTVSWPSGSGAGSAQWVFDPAGGSIVALDDEARWLFEDEVARTQTAAAPVQESRPRLVGLPTVVNPIDDLDDDVDDEFSSDYKNDDDAIEPPAWAGPGQPTMPVHVAPTTPVDNSPSWDDILFGNRPDGQ